MGAFCLLLSALAALTLLPCHRGAATPLSAAAAQGGALSAGAGGTSSSHRLRSLASDAGSGTGAPSESPAKVEFHDYDPTLAWPGTPMSMIPESCRRFLPPRVKQAASEAPHLDPAGVMHIVYGDPVDKSLFQEALHHELRYAQLSVRSLRLYNPDVKTLLITNYAAYCDMNQWFDYIILLPNATAMSARWDLRIDAALHSPFQRTLMPDADTVFCGDVSAMFDEKKTPFPVDFATGGEYGPDNGVQFFSANERTHRFLRFWLNEHRRQEEGVRAGLIKQGIDRRGWLSDQVTLMSILHRMPTELQDVFVRPIRCAYHSRWLGAGANAGTFNRSFGLSCPMEGPPRIYHAKAQSAMLQGACEALKEAIKPENIPPGKTASDPHQLLVYFADRQLLSGRFNPNFPTFKLASPSTYKVVWSKEECDRLVNGTCSAGYWQYTEQNRDLPPDVPFGQYSIFYVPVDMKGRIAVIPEMDPDDAQGGPDGMQR